MESQDLPRVVRGNLGALFVAAFATHGASAGLEHVGTPNVAVDGIFTTEVCGESPCSGLACEAPWNEIRTERSASWRGQWELLYPASRGGSEVRGGLGALASTEFERDASGVTFRATIDRTDREILELDLPSSVSSDTEIQVYGSVGLRGLITGSSRFRLGSDAFVSISGSLEAWDAVAGQLPFASMVSWAIVPLNQPGDAQQGEFSLQVDEGRRDALVDAGRRSVLLPAGEYRLDCSLYASGAVHGPAIEDCPKTVWSDLDVVAVRLDVSEGIPGDLDGNGCVDLGDVAMLLLDYGSGSGPADLDGSGEVDSGDIGMLMTLFSDCG